MINCFKELSTDGHFVLGAMYEEDNEADSDIIGTYSLILMSRAQSRTYKLCLSAWHLISQATKFDSDATELWWKIKYKDSQFNR